MPPISAIALRAAAPAIAAALLTAALAPATQANPPGLSSAASGAAYSPGEVVLHDEEGERVARVRTGESVGDAIRRLRRRPGVRYAVPNYLAHAAGFIPDDPGPGETPGGWQALQWNFLPGTGVNAPEAWGNLIAAGRPGGKGVTVAVLDTGVAYANRGRFRRSPDFTAGRFARGYDTVDDDPYPNDPNGHGTLIAGIIGEETNNGIALTGLAYAAKIMPVRVLDAAGTGEAEDVAEGIRWAADHGADVINLSLVFSSSVRSSGVPEILSALRRARRKGVVVVGASGNEGQPLVAYPARTNSVIATGATTEHGCVAEYSNEGEGLDIVAPGGGADASVDGDPFCRPFEDPGRNIFQLTFQSSVRSFGYPDDFEGTSMSSPHVAAAAALVIASGVVGTDPTPHQVEEQLKATARDLSSPGFDLRSGAGMLDIAAATRPGPPEPPPPLAPPPPQPPAPPRPPAALR